MADEESEARKLALENRERLKVNKGRAVKVNRIFAGTGLEVVFEGFGCTALKGPQAEPRKEGIVGVGSASR